MQLLRLTLLTLFIACGAQESPLMDERDKYPSPYVPASPMTYDGDFDAYQGIQFELNAADEILTSLPAPGGVWNYSLINAPAWMAINSTTSMISGIPLGQGVVTFQVRATDSINPVNMHTSSLKSIAVNGDPLRVHQWHLKNTGQKTFAAFGGEIGFDLNVFPVYAQNITGAGVKVAVSDSGGEINHDDLYENILQGQSKDYTLKAPYFGNPIATSAHGTAVAGIIAARGWNNIGVTGVAPRAKVAIFQFLNSAQSAAILIDQASGDFDIFNYSYGDTLYYDTLSDADYLDHLRHQAKNGRGGKGIFYVKSAGNEFLLADDYSNPSVCASHNGNFPFENESPYMIVVGAIDANGDRAEYSTVGSNLWVSAPGGADWPAGRFDPAILTTDLPTCFKGYSKAQSNPNNDFEYGHSLNPKCNYTSTMNGTSSAAPMVSGVIALLLEANPNLTQRDVKHILASTAKKIDASYYNAGFAKNHPSVAYNACPTLTLAGHEYDQGWITNHAGFHFSNAFGFGLVDVDAAVAMAKNYSVNLGELVELNPYFSNISYRRTHAGLAIPDNLASGVSDTLAVSSTLKAESVQVRVQVSHPRSGQLGVELTSPQGTKSILMQINNSFLISNDSNLNIVLTSHAFYGEDVNGNWTIKIIDGQSGSTGTLTRWDLNILGHN
jgi:subtilisin-like proprotein convertase family protein